MKKSYINQLAFVALSFFMSFATFAQSGTCSNPIQLTCSSPYSGTTVGYSNNLQGYVTPQSSQSYINGYGNEVVHTFTATSNGTLQFSVTRPTGSTADMVVAVLTDCNDVSSNVKAARYANYNYAPMVQIYNVTAGQQFYVIVDGNTSNDNGAYELSVNCQNTTTGNCNNPISLVCGATIHGTTVGGESNFDSYSCGSQPEEGNEKIYTFTLSQTSNVTASLTNLSVDLDIQILGSCNANDCLARHDNTATATSLQPGTYFVVVDGYGVGGNAAEGEFDLSLSCTTVNSPVAGTCANPIALSCNQPHSGTILNGVSDFNSYSCAGSQIGNEKIHTIVLTQASDITASLTGLTDDLDVHILTSCDASSCISTGDNSATATSLVAGTYYVVVDGDVANLSYPNGDYTLRVVCTPVVSNTPMCDNSINVSCGSSLTNQSNANNANNISEYTGCVNGLSNMTGGEVVYEIDLTSGTTLNVVLNSDFQSFITLFSSCDFNACASEGSPVTTGGSFTVNNTGTYYVVVDGWQADPSGVFDIEFNCSTPSTLGSCADPIPLSCGSIYTGSTVGFLNNLQGYMTPNSSQAWIIGEGGDVVHTITPSITGLLQVTLTRASGSTADMVIAVMSDCNDVSSNIKAGRYANYNSSVTMNIYNAVAGQEYFVIVDGNTSSDFGGYELSVACPTISGTCLNPIDISCGNTISGTTVGAESNFDSYSCGSQAEEGNERIYRFSIAQVSDITASLTNMNADLDIQILGSCNANDCLARHDNTATLTSLQPGTYYIVVDGYGVGSNAAEGEFDLSLTCTTVNTASGTCANPIALSCNQPHSGTVLNGVSNFDSYNCAGSQIGDEKIHTITLTQTSDITATLTGLTDDLDVHILTSCDASTCISTGDNSATATSLAAGTYYVVVDGDVASLSYPNGDYTLRVVCTPTVVSTPMCDNATVVVCGDELTNQSNVNSPNNISEYTGCYNGYSNMTGGEVVYSIDLQAGTSLEVILNSDFQSFVTVFSDCSFNGCASGGNSNTGANFTISATGTYYIVIDGWQADPTGNFDISFDCTVAAVTGTCGNPIDLSCGVPFDGTTVDGESLFDQYNCAPNQLLEANEKIHTITLLQPSDLTATLTNLNGVDLDIHILSYCHSDSCITRDNTSAVAQNLPIGTYYIVVDGFTGNGATPTGTYTLTVDCNPLCATSQVTVNNTICSNDSILFSDEYVNIAGTYKDTLVKSSGCDSIITLNLSVEPAYVTSLVQVICEGDSVLFRGDYYKETGIYGDSLQKTSGCDSIMQVELTVMTPYLGQETETTCSSSNFTFGSQTITESGTYTEAFQSVYGCDSTVTLELIMSEEIETSLVEEICQGDFYNFGNQILNSTGSYNQAYQSVEGCDSIVNLTLIVKVRPIISITQNNGDLTSTQGSSYQWFLDGDIINGATNQLYTPTENGVYTVETVAFNGCGNTNNYTIQNVSIVEAGNINLLLMPNPSNGVFTLKTTEEVSYELYNVLGEIVSISRVNNVEHIIDITSKDNGVYILRITTENNNLIIKRIIKQ